MAALRMPDRTQDGHQIEPNAAEKFLHAFAEQHGRPIGLHTPSAQGGFYSYASPSPSRSNSFCRLVRETQVGNMKCQECDCSFAERCIRDGKAIVYTCHAGLIDFAAPVIVKDRAVAVVLTGQLRAREDKHNERALRRVALEIGVSPRRLQEAYSELPIAPKPEIYRLLQAVDAVAKSLARTAESPPQVGIAEVIEQITELTPHLIKYLQEHERDLIKLPSDVFEHLIAEFLASRKIPVVRLVGQSGQTAADIFAMESPSSTGISTRCFVEVKRHRRRIGIEVVDRVYGAMVSERPDWGWHVAMICSISGFKEFRKTSPTKLAFRGVELRGPTDITEWLKAYQLSGHGLWLPKEMARSPIPGFTRTTNGNKG